MRIVDEPCEPTEALHSGRDRKLGGLGRCDITIDECDCIAEVCCELRAGFLGYVDRDYLRAATTFAPRPTITREIAPPIPAAPPVTMTIWLSSCMMSPLIYDCV